MTDKNTKQTKKLPDAQSEPQKTKQKDTPADDSKKAAVGSTKKQKKTTDSAAASKSTENRKNSAASRRKNQATEKKKSSRTRKANQRKRSPAAGRESSSTRRRRQEVRHARIVIACIAAALLIILFLVFVLPALTNSRFVNKGSLVGVNSDVLQYEDSVAAYCKEYHISQFSTLMLAIMQQESSGQGTDVFQCSESPFNTEYSSAPGSISDIDYSIRVGVETFAYCLEQAGCKSISDMDKVKIALQEYNFGNNYAGWALENYGGYSLENAYEFSEMMKAQLGWDTYGDPEYVTHVLQYYTR